MTMDKELKAKWVAALRSGKYKQTVAALERNGANCCLGVLARIQGIPARQASPFEKVTFEFPIAGTEYTTKSVGYPPDGFCGLKYPMINEVAIMNDNGKSFEEIADHIEANF